MIDRLRAGVRAALAPPAPPADPGGLPWDALYPTRPADGLAQRSYQSLRSVPASTSSVLLAPANPARSSLAIVNDGTAELFVALGPVATSATYTLHVGPGATAVLEGPDVYQGDVAGVWDVANGSARLTEAIA